MTVKGLFGCRSAVVSAIFLLCLSYAVADNVTYHIQRIYLDRESTYNVAVLRFQHDALANLPSTDYYVADLSATLCGQSRCLPLSTYTLNTQGIAKLNCPLYVGNDTTSTQSVTLSNGPLSNTISPSELSHKLFFVPPEQYDPLGTYFKVMSGFTIPPASTSFSNQLALVFLAQPDLWDLNTHTLQFDGNRIHLDECTLAIEYNGQSTNYGLNLAERTCDFNRFQLLELQVKTEVATITDIRNYDLLFAKSNEVMMLLSQKIWSDCALMFEELTAIYQNPAVTLEVLDSTTCIHRFGSREYAVDPCCNQTLLYDQCCSVRNYSFIFPQYLTANFSGLNSICPSRNLASLRPEQVHWTFLDSIFQRFRAENPAEGCLVMNEVNERSLNALNSLYRTCHLHIYGERNSGYPCKTDADCLTSCNLVSRTCVIPWADPLGAFVKCFNSSFSPVVKKYVRLAVDPDSNNSNLEDETLHQMLNNLTMTTYDCVGPLADAVRANNSGNINEPLCLDPKACNWRECDGLTQAECSQVCLEKSQYLCGECWEDGTCRDYSETKGCFAATTETAATCETLGGTWVPYERVCRLPQYTNKDECLVGKICADLTMRNEGVNWNRTICPALCYDTKLDINTCKDQDCDNPCCDPNQGCADKTVVDCMCAYDSYCCDKWDSYCARRAIDFKCAKCDCIRRKWHPNSAGGFCESFATSNDCEDVIVNATWWSGRTWRHGRFDNPERCSQGACNIGVQLEPSDCAVTYGCDVPCFQCESNLNEPIELCTSNVPAASCPGYMDAEFNRCTYPNVTRANCTTEHVCATFTHPGVTNCLTEVQVQSISCADLSLQDCQRCQAGLTTCPYNQTNFQCRVASRQCTNETECATTGYCEDAEMIPEVGLCVDSFIINVRNGDAMCREGQTMFRIGCVVPNVTDPINCTAVRDHNGVAYPRWIERSRTQALCASSGTMCLEDEFDVNTDQYIQRRSEKPPAECLACGGRVENVYNWIPGSWKPGVMNPLDWAPRFYGSVNKWIKSVNFTKLQDILDNAITHKTAIQIKSEYLCRFDYLFGFVDHFMCYCGDADCDYGNKEFWYTTSVNMVHVFNNFTKSASAGFATVYFDNSTRILVDNFVATFKTIPATSFVGAENQLSLADRFDDGRNRILIENIVMWEGFEVGILIGDGIEVDFGNNTSAVLDMETGYYVCFERRPEYNISFDDLYPHPDIGEVIYDERWKVHVQPLELEQLDVTSEHICARIKKDGVFVPIMRSELIRDSYWNNMFLWIAIGAYGFMALFAIVMLIVVWTVKNSKSKFMYGYRKWKTLVICTVIFIAIIRGVHLFLIMHLHFLRMNPVHDYILGWYLIEQAPLALMVSAISLLMWTVIHYNGQAIVRYKHRGWFTQGCFVLLFRRNLVHIIINIANLLFYAAILILIEYLRDSRALWDQISKITVTGAMVILAFFTLGAEIANRSAKLIVMMSFLCLAVLAHGAHVCLLNFFGLYFGDPFAWLSLVIYFSAEVVVGCMVCLRTILSPGFKMGGIVPYEIDYSPVSAQKEPEEYEEEDYPPDYDPDAPPDYDPDGPPRPNRPLPYPPVPARTRTRKLPYPPVPPRYKPPEPPVSKSLESAVELEDVTEQELENEYVPPQVHLEEEIEEEEESESEPEPKDDKKRLIPKVQRKGNYGYIRDHRPSYGRSAIPEGVNEGQKDEYSRSLEKGDQIRRPSYGVSQVPKGKVDNLSKSLFINTDALKPPKK